MSKAFGLDSTEIRPLATGYGSCLASDRITMDGQPVGYMYREQGDNYLDSGWRFLAGDESEAYLMEPENFALFDVNTIANYDPAIVPHLAGRVGSAYTRDNNGQLVAANP